MAQPPAPNDQPPGIADGGASDNGDDAPAGEGPAERIIRAFGGIRPMAAKLSAPVTTVQGWKTRGHIPANRVEDIRAAAKQHGITLDEAALTAATAQPPETEPGSSPDATAAAAAAEDRTRTRDVRSPTDRPTDDEDEPSPSEIAGAITTGRIPGQNGPFSRPRPRLLWTIAVSAVIAALVALTEPLWYGGRDVDALETRLATVEAELGQAGETVDPEAVSALQRRIDALEQRLAGVEQADEGGPSAQALGQRLTELTDRMSVLEDRLQGGLASRVAGLEEAVAALDGRVAQAVEEAGRAAGQVDARVTERLAGMDERLAGMDRRLVRAELTDTRLQAAVVILGQLRTRIEEGGDASEMIGSLATLMAGRPEVTGAVDRLADAVGDGVPGRAALVTRFRESARAAREAERRTAETWIDQLEAAAASLVTVRPTPGAVEGETTGAILARAEGRLLDGDLAGAAAAAGALEGPAAEAMAGWLAEAERKLAALAALDALSGLVVARVEEAVPELATPPAAPRPGQQTPRAE